RNRRRAPRQEARDRRRRDGDGKGSSWSCGHYNDAAVAVTVRVPVEFEARYTVQRLLAVAANPFARRSFSTADRRASGWASRYCSGGISPSVTSSRSLSAFSPLRVPCQSEKFSSSRPSFTSCCTSQETGAIFEYQGQTVSLLWQSKQARLTRSLVAGLSQTGSRT